MNNLIPLDSISLPVKVPHEFQFEARSPEAVKESLERTRKIGLTLIAEHEALAQRKIVNCYFRHQTQRNAGFIVLFDYYGWPRESLHHRGYMNSMLARGKFIREADEAERRGAEIGTRCKLRTYQSFDELADDERRCGTSETTIEQMRRLLDPTAQERHEDALRRCEEDLLKYPVKARRRKVAA